MTVYCSVIHDPFQDQSLYTDCHDASLNMAVLSTENHLNVVWVNAGHGRTGTILQVCSPLYSVPYTV
jgi:hypothetical protein